jgi:hypothetical protein
LDKEKKIAATAASIEAAGGEGRRSKRIVELGKTKTAASNGLAKA